jgi:hypothetical protein
LVPCAPSRKPGASAGASVRFEEVPRRTSGSPTSEGGERGGRARRPRYAEAREAVVAADASEGGEGGDRTSWQRLIRTESGRRREKEGTKRDGLNYW